MHSANRACYDSVTECHAESTQRLLHVVPMSKKPTEKALSKASQPPTPPKPFAAPRAVGSFVPTLTKKAFEKFGFSAAALITDWPAIVGRELATYTAPEKIRWPRASELPSDTEPEKKGRPGALLILRVEGPRALDVEYKRAEIAERINAYFGYRAINEIKILQAPLAKPPPTRVPKRTEADAVPLPMVADEGLRAALERLGAGIRAKKRQAK